MELNLFVNGYNKYLANPLSGAVKYVPDALSGTLDFLAKELPAKGLKTLVIKPFIVAGMISKTFWPTSCPALLQVATDASRTKALISGLEIFTKLPKMFRTLSKPVDVEKPEDTREYASIYRMNNKEHEEKLVQKAGPQLTATEAVFSRIVPVADWCIAAADAASLVRNYRPLNKTLDTAIPYIYAFVGGYMGAQGLHSDLKFAYYTWKDAAGVEKSYESLNILTSVAYLFTSIVGGLGIYYKDKAPDWLGRYQFTASIAIVLLPAVQKCAERWMEVNVWKKADKPQS